MMTEAQYLEYVSRYSRYGQKDPKQTGSGFLVHCPAHDDRTPSLHISRMESGKVLHHCFAGCPWEEILPFSAELQKDLDTPQARIRGRDPRVRDLKTSKRRKNWIWTGEFHPSMLPQCKHLPHEERWSPSREKRFLADIQESLSWSGETGPKLPAEKIWGYESASTPGKFFCLVTRHRSPNNRKIIRPWALTRRVNGNLTLQCFWPPAPRILYRARKLNDYIQLHKEKARILVTEGEKSAVAAQILFPDCFVTTWPGGTNSWHHSDFTCLRQHSPMILFWPDNDPASMKAMQNIALLVGQRKSRFPDFIGLLGGDSSRIQGWDAGDALEQGWTAETVRELRKTLPRRDSLKIIKQAQGVNT